MEYILVSQLKLILLRLSNSDDEVLTVVIISFLLLLYFSKFFIVYFYIKHYFVNDVLFCLFIIFAFHRPFFKPARSWSSLEKSLYEGIIKGFLSY